MNNTINTETFAWVFGHVLVTITNEKISNIFLSFSDSALVVSDKLSELSTRAFYVINNDKIDDNIPLIFDHGTDFQLKVWNMLKTIPRGKTATYKEIAQQIGMPLASRAVANACGANPIPILVPCHRAIRSDGSLGGYNSGIVIKKFLLDREKLS